MRAPLLRAETHPKMRIRGDPYVRCERVSKSSVHCRLHDEITFVLHISFLKLLNKTHNECEDCIDVLFSLTQCSSPVFPRYLSVINPTCRVGYPHGVTPSGCVSLRGVSPPATDVHPTTIVSSRARRQFHPRSHIPAVTPAVPSLRSDIYPSSGASATVN
jgi:hypothetical protein